MTTKQIGALFAIFLLALIFSGFEAGAQDDLKGRMRARLPEIMELKSRGIIGETRDGYLAYVVKDPVKEDLVAAENQDRRSVYAAIARQEGISEEYVGQRRARQIAEQARSREWLQDSNGIWYQK
jgi:uncharacterized protein